MNKIEEKVVEIIQDKIMLDKMDINENTLLFEDDILDSLKSIHLMIELEKKFDITIDQTQITMNDFQTIKSIGNMIERQREKVKNNEKIY